RRPAVARSLKAWLPTDEVPAEGDMERMLAGPESYLDRLPINFAITRGGREMAIAALVRVAREDALAAYVRFSRLNDRFSAAERGYVYSVIGWLGAEQHLIQAAEWFKAAGDVPMSADQREWRVRAALRLEDWRAVARAIEGMPDEQRAETTWTYWLARAQEKAGRREEARRLYATIADETDFYGLLAAEELGRKFETAAAGGKSGGEEAARAESDPGLRRALALFRLDLRTEAVREWNWALRDRDDRFLLAAADLARRNEIYDRAINTAELARGMSDYELRFLAPYRQIIEPQARQQGLDVSWVYGLMRQESRFISVARSNVGAQGLMQVMPATGKWVAGKLGLKGYSLSWLRDPDTNVMIGTNYMRLIMEGLDNHPVLASAGYNAGPGRARRWRDTRPLEGAIYAETIPFDETRDYVKKVMANSVVYGALFEGRPQSLKGRLGTVMPGQ
ncbi:MAG: lytic transglycosylase domain-containing protein, partial [Rhodocyclaceae bacterium]|nr:lytic transglycosylase domain-containing protein [Rhodocyclaceae bacterium]